MGGRKKVSKKDPHVRSKGCVLTSQRGGWVCQGPTGRGVLPSNSALNNISLAGQGGGGAAPHDRGGGRERSRWGGTQWARTTGETQVWTPLSPPPLPLLFFISPPPLPPSPPPPVVLCPKRGASPETPTVVHSEFPLQSVVKLTRSQHPPTPCGRVVQRPPPPIPKENSKLNCDLN